MNSQKLNAMKKITEEFKILNLRPLVNLGITVGLFNEDNIFEWRCFLLWPKDTFYKGGFFILKIIFPDDYPNSRPEALFLTPIYHLNVKYFSSRYQPLGHISINTLNEWKPEYSTTKLLSDIFVLLYKNNPDCSYDDKNNTRRDEYINNSELFIKKAKYFTKKYATPFSKNKEFPNGWDFSYPE